MGYKAFFRYTTVKAMVNVPNKCILGAISIMILDAYIREPNIANTVISLVVSFTFIPP